MKNYRDMTLEERAHEEVKEFLVVVIPLVALVVIMVLVSL